jgi:hypothetical protein
MGDAAAAGSLGLQLADKLIEIGARELLDQTREQLFRDSAAGS